MYGLPILHRNQENAASNHLEEFTLHGQAAYGGDGIRQALVAVDLQLSLVRALSHGGGNHPHHPHNAQDVVRVLMGHENVVDMA